MGWLAVPILLQAATDAGADEGPGVVVKVIAGAGLVAILVICAVVMFLKSTGSSEAQKCGRCDNDQCG